MTALSLVISSRPIIPVFRSVFKTTCVMCLTGELYRNGLMFVPYIIRRSGNNQHYALIFYRSFGLYTGSYMFRQ
jgi:hypothetical protein